MASIHLICSNPKCRQELSFSLQKAGSLQSCFHCGQQVMVPVADDELYHDYPPIKDDSIFSAQQAPISRMKLDNENMYKTNRRKKVKAGPGCLAMFATMAGIFVIAIGMMMSDLMDWSSIGMIVSLAGAAGIGAFAYFGYFAIEGDDDRYDKERRKQRYD